MTNTYVRHTLSPSETLNEIDGMPNLQEEKARLYIQCQRQCGINKTVQKSSLYVVDGICFCGVHNKDS